MFLKLSITQKRNVNTISRCCILPSDHFFANTPFNTGIPSQDDALETTFQAYSSLFLRFKACCSMYIVKCKFILHKNLYLIVYLISNISEGIEFLPQIQIFERRNFCNLTIFYLFLFYFYLLDLLS